jgi:hypothetical protein
MPRVAVDTCPKCGQPRGAKHVPTTKQPTLATMERWDSEGAARATDGCRVEMDGQCVHGHTSWVRVLKLI